MKYEYQVVHGCDPDVLGVLVTAELASGWELWGNPFAVAYKTGFGGNGENYCQSMVRHTTLLISDVGKIDVTASADLPIAHSIQVPGTLEVTDRPVVESALPLFRGVLCCCNEWVGDNKDCRVHYPTSIANLVD